MEGRKEVASGKGRTDGMKTIALIEGLCSGVRIPGTNDIGGLDRQIFERLCEIYPNGRRGNLGHCFRSDLMLDDPRTHAILETLETAGLKRWKKQGEKKHDQYMFALLRTYDDSDLEACEYLEIVPEKKAKGLFRTDEPLPQRGRTVIESPAKHHISYVFTPTWYIIRDDAKQALENAGLQNLLFLPTEKKYESVDYDLYDEEDVWWELRSDLRLPPVSSSMTLLHRDQTAFSGDFSKGCMRKEGFYNHAELYYRRKDLAAFGSFDLAHTHEMFGGGINEFNRPLVASKRFYDVCMQHNIKTGWVPVRIED